ncbi:hypothetical protein FHX16_005651 [Rhizobium sp. BK661]|nr:hypothetical protein [Rhizobium sp. BK661]
MQDHRIARHPVLSLGTVAILRFLATTTELRSASMFRARPFLARRRHESLLLLVVASGFSKAVLLHVLGDARLQWACYAVPAQVTVSLASHWRPLENWPLQNSTAAQPYAFDDERKIRSSVLEPTKYWKARSGSPSAKVFLIQTSLPPYNSCQLQQQLTAPAIPLRRLARVSTPRRGLLAVERSPRHRIFALGSQESPSNCAAQ